MDSDLSLSIAAGVGASGGCSTIPRTAKWLIFHAWTDAGQADPFVVLSRGRAVVRFEDLLRLVKLIEDLKQRIVKKIRPNV